MRSRYFNEVDSFRLLVLLLSTRNIFVSFESRELETRLGCFACTNFTPSGNAHSGSERHTKHNLAMFKD